MNPTNCTNLVPRTSRRPVGDEFRVRRMIENGYRLLMIEWSDAAEDVTSALQRRNILFFGKHSQRDRHKFRAQKDLETTNDTNGTNEK
jgi:hypothetical protein